MELDNERDLISFVDDDGKEVLIEVMDYLSYEGKMYALLAEYDPDAEDDAVREAFVMKVLPVADNDEEEEFVPVEDEQLAETLIEIFQSNDFEEVMDEDFDDED